MIYLFDLFDIFIHFIYLRELRPCEARPENSSIYIYILVDRLPAVDTNGLLVYYFAGLLLYSFPASLMEGNHS